MPLYRIETIKQWGQAEWGNRYYVNATDEADAAVQGAAIAMVEKAHTASLVLFHRIRVSTAAADGRTGRTYPINEAGSVNMTYPLPIEVCVVVQFYPGQKQAGKKFYHFACDGNFQAAGLMYSTGLTQAQDFAADLAALGTLRDSSGAPYTSATAEAQLGNHQMHRAWAARSGIEGGDL